MGLRVVGAPEETIGSEGCGEPVDEVAWIACGFGLFQQVRRHFERDVRLRCQREQIARLLVGRAATQVGKGTVIERDCCLGEPLEHRAQLRELAREDRDDDGETELGCDLPEREGVGVVESRKRRVLDREQPDTADPFGCHRAQSTRRVVGGVDDHHAGEPIGIHPGRVDHVAVVEAVRAHGLDEHGPVDAGRRHPLQEALHRDRCFAEPVEADAGGMEWVSLAVGGDDVDVRVDDHTAAGIGMPYNRDAFRPSTPTFCSSSRSSRSRTIRTVSGNAQSQWQ